MALSVKTGNFGGGSTGGGLGGTLYDKFTSDNGGSTATFRFSKPIPYNYAWALQFTSKNTGTAVKTGTVLFNTRIGDEQTTRCAMLRSNGTPEESSTVTVNTNYVTVTTTLGAFSQTYECELYQLYSI